MARPDTTDFQSTTALDLVARISTFQDSLRGAQTTAAGGQLPAGATPFTFTPEPVYDAIAYICGEHAPTGTRVVPVTDRTRVKDDFMQLLSEIAYDVGGQFTDASGQRASYAFVGLPRVVAALPDQRAAEWVKMGLGSLLIDDAFIGPHAQYRPQVTFPVGPQLDQEYFSLGQCGQQVFDALKLLPVPAQTQQGQQQTAPGSTGRWKKGLAAALVFGAISLGGLANYHGCFTSRPSSKPASVAPTPVAQAPVPAPHLDAMSPDAGADATVVYRADGSVLMSPAPITARDGGLLYTAPPAPRTDGGIAITPITPVTPVVPVTPYTASTPSPRMDGGIPAGPSVVTPPYVAAPTAPVVPTAPVAPTVPAPVVVCPPVTVCLAPADPMVALLTQVRDYVQGHSWQDIEQRFAGGNGRIIVSIADYTGSDKQRACSLAIERLVERAVGSVADRTSSLYKELSDAVLGKALGPCMQRFELQSTYGGKIQRNTEVGFGF